MAGLQGKPTRGLKENNQEAVAHSERFDTKGGLPGKISSFDPTDQTVTVSLKYKPRLNGKPVDMPPLKKVPLQQMRNGHWAITMPIKAGDPVKVDFAMRSLDNWFKTGDASDVDTARAYEWSDGIATLGLASGPEALPNYDTENFEIRTADGQSASMKISPDGKFSLANNGEELITIIWELLDLLEKSRALITYGSSAGLHPIRENPDWGALKTRLETLKLA